MKFDIADPLEQDCLAHPCPGPAITRHLLQRNPRDDDLMWPSEIVQMGGNVHILSKNIIAVGSFDIQNVAVM
jgi:hypothetical protein